ncbi:hypothetical protein ACS0TY_012984 [Phlomoides rotata]
MHTPAAAASCPPLQGNGMQTHTQWGSRSFADVVRPKAYRPHSAPTPESMKPSKHGDFYSIEIDEEIYQQGVADLQDCLIGRIMMSQGDKPYSTFELEKKLHEVWHMKGNLELIPLNRGYYTIRFSLLEDWDRIFKRRHWLLQQEPSVYKIGFRTLIPTKFAHHSLKFGSALWISRWNIGSQVFSKRCRVLLEL